MKEDHPFMTAIYIIVNNVNWSKQNDRSLTWAKKVIQDTKGVTRRPTMIYDYYLNKNKEVHKVQRIQNNNKKKRKYKPKTT